jgi:hypothetical protein
LSWSSESLSSTCSPLLEWPSTVFFVDWRKFLFPGFLFDSFFWGFIYLYSAPLLLFCIVIFNSYHSLFIVSFFSLWYLLKSSLSSFICFCVFSCY